MPRQQLTNLYMTLHQLHKSCNCVIASLNAAVANVQQSIIAAIKRLLRWHRSGRGRQQANTAL